VGHSHRNRLLSWLLKSGLRLLEPSLEPVALSQHQRLEEPNSIANVYFIENGMASVVAQLSAEQVEIALIGREGMTGLAIVMDTDRSPHETVVQKTAVGFASLQPNYARHWQ
jgi:hypothetical protein